MIQPDCTADHLRWKPMLSIQTCATRTRASATAYRETGLQGPHLLEKIRGTQRDRGVKKEMYHERYS